MSQSRPPKLRRLSTVQIAFGDVSANIGIVFTFLSLASLAAKIFELGLTEGWRRIVGLYHAVVHQAFDLITVNLLDLTLEYWVKDLLTIYACLGAVTVRAYASLYRIHWVSRWSNLSSRKLGWLAMLADRSRLLSNAVIWALWPYVGARLMRGRMLYKLIGHGGTDGNGVVHVDLDADGVGPMPTFAYRMSLVFLLQMLALVAMTVAFVASNVEAL